MSCLASFGPIAFGDCGPKSDIKIETTSLTKNISNSIQQSVSNVSDKTIAVQSQNVKVKGSCCRPLVIKQGLTIKQASTSKFTANFAESTAKTMKDAISSSLDQSASQITGVLGAVNGPKLTAAIKNTVEKITNSSAFKNSIQTKLSESFGSQNQNIDIDCGSGEIPTPLPPPGQKNPATGQLIPDQGCYVDQNFVFDQVTNNLMETLMNQVSQDEQLTAIANEAKQKNTTEGKGFDSLIAAFTGPMAIVAVVVVVALIAAVPLLIFAFKSKVSKRRYYF